MKKTVYTLNINNYAPELRELTRPFLMYWVNKIGADYYEITKRKFPKLDIEMEKLQIYELSQKHGNDWNIYFDSDALIHPELFDMTDHINKDTVMHIGSDMAGVRWRYDRFFSRDGRHIGSCNWFACASDLNIELWKPLDDLTYEEALENIFPIPMELHTVVTREHLITDYILSRNIAKYGLKFKSFMSLLDDLKMPGSEFFYHVYTVNVDEKISRICNTIKNWYLHSLQKTDDECQKMIQASQKLPMKDRYHEAQEIIKSWKL